MGLPQYWSAWQPYLCLFQSWTFQHIPIDTIYVCSYRQCKYFQRFFDIFNNFIHRSIAFNVLVKQVCLSASVDDLIDTPNIQQYSYHYRGTPTPYHRCLLCSWHRISCIQNSLTALASWCQTWCMTCCDVIWGCHAHMMSSPGMAHVWGIVYCWPTAIPRHLVTFEWNKYVL